MKISTEALREAVILLFEAAEVLTVALGNTGVTQQDIDERIVKLSEADRPKLITEYLRVAEMHSTFSTSMGMFAALDRLEACLENS